MFLLNSRSPLVTATSRSHGWHPFNQGNGAILPNSLAWVVPSRLGLLTQGHLCRFSVRSRVWPHVLFHGHAGSAEADLRSASSRIQPFLTMTVLRGLRRLNTATAVLDLPECVRTWAERPRCRNINLLPFRRLRLRGVLGPTNPRLMNIVEEPWPFRRMGFSPIYAATLSRILVRTRSTGPHGPASAHARHLPTRSPCGCSGVSVAGLAPSIFGAHDLDW